MVKDNKIAKEKVEKTDCNCNRKKVIIGIACLVVVVTAIVLLIICLGKNKSNEKELEANLGKLGKQFYTEFYYPAQEKSQKDVKTFVAKFEKTGIKVNLENISKFSKIDKELVDSMVNSKTKEKCDAVNSYVVIKPVSPYGKKDIKVEVNLACGFDKKETKKVEKKEVTKTETKKVTDKKTTDSKTTKTQETTKTNAKKTSKK